MLTVDKPLTSVIFSTSSLSCPCEFRNLVFIAEFIADNRRLNVASSTGADALSRSQLNALEAQLLRLIPLMLRFLMHTHKTMSWDIMKLRPSQSAVNIPRLLNFNVTLVCGASVETTQSCVPEAYSEVVFLYLHMPGHLGIRSTQHKIASRLVWSKPRSAFLTAPAPGLPANAVRFVAIRSLFLAVFYVSQQI